MTAERLFFVETEVNPLDHDVPTGDGSPFEAYGHVIQVFILDILRAIDEGYIIDSNTEIGVRRLYNVLNW